MSAPNQMSNAKRLRAFNTVKTAIVGCDWASALAILQNMMIGVVVLGPQAASLAETEELVKNRVFSSF